MLFVLTVIRYINRIKWRLFGRSLPHWASDSLGFISYFDFISFVPTSLLIVLAPGHFFRPRSHHHQQQVANLQNTNQIFYSRVYADCCSRIYSCTNRQFYAALVARTGHLYGVSDTALHPYTDNRYFYRQ